MRGTVEQMQFWGIGNIENQDFDFGEQGNKAIYFRGAREQISPWEGLTHSKGALFVNGHEYKGALVKQLVCG